MKGIDFDGSTNYINLGANTINVVGDLSIGNGFGFETYVKNIPVNSYDEIIDINGSWSQTKNSSN